MAEMTASKTVETAKITIDVNGCFNCVYRAWRHDEYPYKNAVVVIKKGTGNNIQTYGEDE